MQADAEMFGQERVNELMGQLREVEGVNHDLNLQVQSMKRIALHQSVGIVEIDNDANYSGKISSLL